jgi:hypothetical protein
VVATLGGGGLLEDLACMTFVRPGVSGRETS